jgi:magnesium-transporting ATPase (P-type)
VCGEQINRLERDDVESELSFAGFLVFHCPLKPDAVKTLKALNDSSHRVGFICFFGSFSRALTLFLRAL